METYIMDHFHAILLGYTVEPLFSEHPRDQAFMFAQMGLCSFTGVALACLVIGPFINYDLERGGGTQVTFHWGPFICRALYYLRSSRHYVGP